MHNIESFHAIANLVDRTCRCRYDALGGLTIEGLTASEARLALHLLEQVSENKDVMVALATGRGVAPAPAGPVQPSGAPNAAKWGPATPSPAPAAKPPEETPSPRPRSRPVVPPADAGAPVPPPAPPEPHRAAEAPAETPPAPPTHTGPVPAQPEPAEAPKDEPVGESEPVEANIEPTPDKASRKKPSGPRKPPPRVSELEQAALLGTGGKHEDVEIVEHKDHGDGGRLLVRADGWRVKIDRNGREVTRVEGEPPVDVSDVPTADTLEAKPANERKAYPVTEELLETRMAREVVQHMLDHGITKRDELVEECLKLKERGAKAFANSKDREAVERRVTSTLIVMGKDAG